MLDREFPTWPSYSLEEGEAVKDVLLSNKVNYWTGEQCQAFESEFATLVNTEFAVAVANGTVALDLAFKALGLAAGDEVIVTSRTFIAPVSSIINAQAKPVFADVDLKSQNITAASIASVLTKKTKAIVCVHLAGWPCDMDPIMALATQHSLFVVEDCAQAHGAVYKGRPVGSIGHIGCWSFCQDKIITTGGEGGMVTTNDKYFWSKMWSFKDHGKNWDTVFTQEQQSGFRWLHSSFGTNWRMTEMQAVIGRIQIKRLPDWNKKRLENANRVWQAALLTGKLKTPAVVCDDCNLSCNRGVKGCKHAAYKSYVFVDGTKNDRDLILSRMTQQGVPCFTGSCSEVYLEKAFDQTSLRPERRLANAESLGDTSLMFLCHPTLTDEDMDLICSVLTEQVCDYFS
jgi:dTDP-4-amino-4,6-dideoxygalactose transaminase